MATNGKRTSKRKPGKNARDLPSKHGVTAEQWAAMRPAERIALHRKATGQTAEDLAAWEPPRPSPERIGAVRRLFELLEDLKTIAGAIDDAERPDSEVRAHIEHVNRLWATHLRVKSLDAPAWLALAQCVDIVSEERDLFGEGDQGRALSALSIFRLRYPEVAARLDRARVAEAIAAWRSVRGRWKALRELARSCGLQPPEARTMKEQFSRRKTAGRRALHSKTQRLHSKTQRLHSKTQR